jgi:hypothetical protein
MKNIVLFILSIIVVNINAEMLEDNNYTKYNYCTYTNSNQIVSIDKNVSVKELKRQQQFILTHNKKYDRFFFKIEYNETIPIKISQYTLATARLLREKLFDKNGYLKKIIDYDNNHTECNVEIDVKDKKTIKSCTNGEKTITFHKKMSDEGYKVLRYKNNKYLGKTLIYWNQGKLYRYDAHNKLLYKTDELIHATDIINFFDINGSPPLF